MSERDLEQKGSIDYSFGGKESREIPEVSFDDEVAGIINDDKGNLGVWPDNTGGVSEFSLRNTETPRPVEDNDELDNWPNPE